MNEYLQGGIAVSLIAVITIFLKYMRAMRRDFLHFLSNDMGEQNEAFNRLAIAINELMDFLKKNSK